MNNKHLILFLGKGQKILTNLNDTTYRKAKYILQNNPDEVVETPFVGEAIIKLHQGRFTHCHIFGTKNAMWETLFARLVENYQDDIITNQFLSLNEKITQGTIVNEDLSIVSNYFRENFKLEVDCRLIDIGKTEEEIWQIFNSIIEIDMQSGDEISIDITHSLRFHPIVVLMSLFYFKAVKKDITIGSLFYGGLELTNDFNGFAPIFDLKPFVEMLDWIDAANSFSHYGDTSLIAKLLTQKNIDPDITKSLIYFANVIQLNTLTEIKANSKNLVKAINRLKTDGGKLKALELVIPSLKQFPEEIIKQQNIPRIMFTVAKRNWEKGQLGLAILTLWEAVIERLAEIYGVDANKKNDYGKITALFYNNKLESINLRKFHNRCIVLSKFRNSIAHAEQGEKFNPNQVIANGEDLIKFFEENLFDPELSKKLKSIKLE